MVADWACEQSGAADIRKLWLFDNRLADAGAVAVAQILAAHPGMQEVGVRCSPLLSPGRLPSSGKRSCQVVLLALLLAAALVADANTLVCLLHRPQVHLSHNMLTLAGAAALLEALALPPQQQAGLESSPVEAATEAAAPAAPAAEAAGGRGGASAGKSRPVWLRLEWNRISLEGLMKVLEAQHAQRGLLVDLPTAMRADAGEGREGLGLLGRRAPACQRVPRQLAGVACHLYRR